MLTKIVNFFSQDWESKIVEFFKKNRNEINLFLIIFLIEVFVYGQKFISNSLATDDYGRFLSGGGDQAHWNGRWLNGFLSRTIFSGYLHILPYWNFLLGLFFIVLAGFLSTRILNLSTSFSKIIFTLLCTVTPFFAENFFFNTNFQVWLFTFIGVYGFYLITCKGYKRINWILGAIFLIASISVYQTILQVCLAILLFKSCLEILKSSEKEKIMSVIKQNSFYVIFLILCFFIYLLINSFYIQLMGLEVAARYKTALNFKSILVFINRVFKTYNFSPHYELFERLFNLFVYSIYFLAIVGSFFNIIKNKKKQYFIKLLTLFFTFLFIPIIINLPTLLGVGTPTRAHYTVGWVLAGCFLLSLTYITKFLKNLNIFFFIITIMFSIYYVNIYFYRMSLQTEFDLRLANQIVGVIRLQAKYKNEKKPLNLRIVGEKSFVFKGGNADMYQQAFAQSSSKYNIFKYFTDLNFQKMNDKKYQQIIKTIIDKGKRIDAYPAKDSLYVNGQDVILFLSPKAINEKIKPK